MQPGGRRCLVESGLVESGLVKQDHGFQHVHGGVMQGVEAIGDAVGHRGIASAAARTPADSVMMPLVSTSILVPVICSTSAAKASKGSRPRLLVRRFTSRSACPAREAPPRTAGPVTRTFPIRSRAAAALISTRCRRSTVTGERAMLLYPGAGPSADGRLLSSRSCPAARSNRCKAATVGLT